MIRVEQSDRDLLESILAIIEEGDWHRSHLIQPISAHRQAAFNAGRASVLTKPECAIPSLPAGDYEALCVRLDAPAYWFSGSVDGHEGENDAPKQAAAAIRALVERVRELGG